MGNKFFVLPPIEIYSSNKHNYFDNYPTYSYYNYLRSGFIQNIKRQRFEVALRLAEPWFHSSNAIDFGCADGVFLPSLSRYFSHVFGVDASSQGIKIAQELCDLLNLTNVKIVHNQGKPPEASKPDLEGKDYKIAFLLEIIEHVGRQPNIYETKIEFLESVFELLKDDGVIIFSVPKMVGIRFLIKYVTQTILGMDLEKYTISQLLKSSFFKNTDEIEPLWAGGHKGFNHLKLEELLYKRFNILRSTHTLTTNFYSIKR